MKNLLLAVAWIFSSFAAFAQTYTVTPASSSYSASGGQITFTVNLAYPADVSAVGFSVRPPASTWTFVSTAGPNLPAVKPNAGDTIDPSTPDSSFNFSYTDVTANSASFTFTLQYPSGLSGNQTITFGGIYRLAGVLTNVTVAPVTVTLSTTAAPAFTTQPESITAPAGQGVSFYVVANGTPFPTLKWQRKPGGSSTWTDLTETAPYSGVTSVVLSIMPVETAMNGDMFRAIATNGIVPDATSSEATLTVLDFSAAHSVAAGPVAGGTVTIANTFTYTGELASMSWTVLLPTGFKFVSNAGVGSPTVSPSPDDIGVISWVWSTIPASGSTFTYTLSTPASLTGAEPLKALAEFTMASNSQVVQFIATPNPLILTLYHTADTNKNWKIDVSELSRVVTLYNARFTTADGKIRTGAYKVDALTADGFAPDTSRDGTETVTLTQYHSADYNKNGKIDVAELSRVVTLYNARFTTPDGKIRTGYYKRATGTSVDGYEPDPTRDPSL